MKTNSIQKLSSVTTALLCSHHLVALLSLSSQDQGSVELTVFAVNIKLYDQVV